MLFFLLLFGSTAKGWNQAHAADNFYYSDGQKIPLKLSLCKVAVRFRVAPAAVGSQLQDLIEVPKGQKVDKDLIIVPLKGKTNDVPGVLGRLKADSAVEAALPVFDAPGADMVITDEFIAKFKPEASQEDVTRINARYGVEIIKKAPWEPNTYILRAPQSSALETANRYHEMDKIEYAHPNFVRFMQQPALPGASSRNRSVWGPDNKLLPPDFVVPKGAEGYRVMEKVQLTRDTSMPPPNSQVEPNAAVTKNVMRSEGFEGGIPADFHPSGSPTWGATTYRKYEGTRSAYCVGSSVSAPAPYPANANAWMIYGPFSLADAQDARLSLRTWIKTEATHDYIFIGASTNGVDFSGYKISGDWSASGWRNMACSFSDLSGLPLSNPAMIGQPQVWFALVFKSDSSVQSEGVYVDKLVLEKITGGYESITNDVLEHYQWSLSNNGQRWGAPGMDLKAVSAWGKVPATSNVTIAIIDSGVQLDHPDLVGKLVAGYDATGHGSGGGPGDGGPNDAHGTNCAGIAAAVTNNTLGVAGVANNCKIMPVRIGTDNPNPPYNWTTDAWLADGISWAANHGADVLSNSWGGGSPATVVTNAITNAKTAGRGGKGCVVCFSSGNNNGPVSYPANLGNVLAVGAMSPTGERKSPNSSDGEFWWGSNYGPELDIVAPGVLCYSTDITGAAGYWNGDYFPNFNGTSAACPHVAGVAGLVLSRNASMTATRVENALLSSATDLSTPGWDPQTGYGLVNAYGAVLKASGSPIPFLPLLLLD